MSNIFNSEYKVYSMPKIASDCALEIQRYTQAPLPLICSSLLGAMATAIQRHIDVQFLFGLISPTSLMILVQAESGERKSTVDKLTMRAIVEFNSKKLEEYKINLDQYKLEHSKWKRKLGKKLVSWKKMVREDEDVNDIEIEISDIEAAEPFKPKKIKLLINDATPEAIIQSLHDNGGCLAIVAGEGGLALDGRTLSNPYVLNSAWGGETIDVDRKTGESYHIADPRLTTSFMLQPSVMEKLLRKNGIQFRGNGLWARMLHCFPPTTQGTRFVYNSEFKWEYLPVFQARLMEILEMSTVNDDGSPKDRFILKMTPEAQQVLIDFYNRVEYDLGAGQFLSDVKDAASKITENAARIAALFYFLEGREGDIDAPTVINATNIAEYYMMEFKLIFGENNQVPIEVQDAMAIEKWIYTICLANPTIVAIPKNDVAQFGPNHLRHDKRRREAALNTMAFNNRVILVVRAKKKWVSLNPAYFPIQAVTQQSLPASTPITQSTLGLAPGRTFV